MKQITITAICIFMMMLHSAQHASAQKTPSQLMAGVYQKYDNTPYLSFDVKYLYSSDTLNGKYQNEMQEGTYTMAGQRARYQIGDVEFMQNDSFLIVVQNKYKIIMVSPPHTNNGGDALPMRQMIDSMLISYGKNYTISSSFTGDSGMVVFDRADSFAHFDRFAVVYDSASSLIKDIRYDFHEPELTNPDDTTGAPPVYVSRRKSFTVSFSNYRLDHFTPDSYSENNYIWLDNGQWKAVARYRDYQVYYSRPNF